MKRLSTIIMALALVLGMSQCKKQETPTTGNTTPTNPGVHITVNVGDQDGKDGKDNNGEKHYIAPAYGLFSFSNGDQLYVGHNGEYVGTLTFANGFFSGDIYPDQNVNDQPLHFYFVGNAAVTGTPVAEQTTSLSISIADQSENLPVLSYGASTKPFTGAGTTYSTMLKNKCALVRFDLQNQGDYEVTLSNVPTLATVNFANPTAETAIVATEGQTNANMTLYGEEGNTAIRWAILLPGTNLGDKIGEDEGDLSWNGEGELPVMDNNTYINSGLSINNPLPLPDAPDAEYAVKTSDDVLTQFSVSGDKKVYFSKANLKYNETTHVWSFHENQYDGCFGVKTGSMPSDQGNNISPAGSDMDRFSWGLTDVTTTGEYDFVEGYNNLSVDDGTDWGCVFKAEGYNEGTNWRTLTAEEWNFLLNDKTGVRGDKRFVKASFRVTVTNPNAGTTQDNIIVSGLFIAPDHLDISSFNFGSDFIAETDWNNAGSYLNLTSAANRPKAMNLLAAGCVFLPALGHRDGNGYQYYNYYCNSWSTVLNNNPKGCYWSATCCGQSAVPQAMAMGFEKEKIGECEINDSYPQRTWGMCVRLVWDAN